MANEATNFKAARAENFRQVVLDEDGFAESVTHYPRGIMVDGVDYTALVHLNDEGTTPVDDDHGSQVVRDAKLTLDADIVVTIAALPRDRDTFLIRGQLWGAVKILTSTPYRQVVAIERTEGVSTKRTRVGR